MSPAKPRLTLAAIRDIKHACAQLTRNSFIELVAAQGKPLAEATAIADEQAVQFEYLFFQADEQVLALFDIVKDEAEMRATEAEIEQAVQAICRIYMRQIVKFAAQNRNLA
jgi:hypothetical protein